MADALNYEVVTKAANKANLLLWLTAESKSPCDYEDEGTILRFKFSDLDDAFRFRLRFDELIQDAS